MSGIRKLLLVLLTAALLSGCSARTVDELYCLPKRSEEFNNLQSAISKEMDGLEYCAPLTGENLQTLQMADLDGDGVQEYLLFTKGASDKPLQILIFREEDEKYVLSDTIQSAGAAFDVVEYARIDNRPGYELIVGRRVSDQVTRSVSVYQFVDGKAVQLMNTAYTKLVPYDMNADGRCELVVLHPGEAAQINGLADAYSFIDGAMVRSNQVNMSESVDQIKRIVAGQLHGGTPAVYVASAVGENAIITDVFAQVNGQFTNVTFSNESGTSVQTLRNYYVYADDIDEDGVVELPNLITMESPVDASIADMQYLIRWYAMTATGDEKNKMFTYHNFQSGWYVTLESDWAPRVAVVQQGNAYEFYLWDAHFIEAKKLFTVYAYTGKDRDSLATTDNRFRLYKTDSVVYAAYLEVASADYGIDQDKLIANFHLIHQDWKTGET